MFKFKNSFFYRMCWMYRIKLKLFMVEEYVVENTR